jgi:hypothetical protein
MIAVLLAAQLSAEIVRAPNVIAPPKPTAVESGLLVQRRLAPAKACGGAGRMEVSLAVPAALYRHGDRPAVGLKKWADYPDAARCLVESRR